MPQLLKLWLNQNHQSLENAISADRATVDEKADKAHLETPHFKKYKATTKAMVKSLKLVETTPILLGAKSKL